MCSRIVVLVLSCAVVSLSAAAEPPHPHWIWKSGEAEGTERFVHSFQTQLPASSAVIRFAPASTALTLSLDDQVIAVAEPYDPIQEVEIETRIGSGDHRIEVEAGAVEGPSAFFLQLDLRLTGKPAPPHHRIVTDARWRDSDGAAVADLGPVASKLLVPRDRRVGIDVVDNYEQWKQALGADRGADPASFLIAPGFEIEMVRSAREEEDSWVSLIFDSQGRAIVAKEQAGLLRLTLSDQGNSVEKVESFAESLQECRGLAFIGDDLYANANNSRGLFKLAADGDRYSKPQLLYASPGGVGHGRNDLAVGPDGMLYSIHGDAVNLPTDAIDYTSPFRDARRGKETREGHLLRIDPSSGEIELLAAGLRNPFGIDFNDDGEIFTYDADAEHDMGAPWYRPTRVNHLVIGGDYGWRGVTGSWPPYYPDHADNAQPSLDIGKGSPTAVKFGTRSNFPKPYRDALFILDWAYGRIIAVHMVPRGSSYLMAAETFLKGRPLNVTDLDFAADGSMYLVTGGRKTQSALYRIRYRGRQANGNEVTTPMRQASSEFARQSRLRLHELATKPRHLGDRERLDEIWHSLSDPDPRIRRAARNAVEHYPRPWWESRALTEVETRGAFEALLALARSQPQRSVTSAILRRLNELFPQVDAANDRQTALYTYWLCLRQHGIEELDSQLRAAIVSQLASQYPARSICSFQSNRLLSEMLVQLQADEVVPKTIQLLNEASSQVEQMHYLYVLRDAGEGWTMEDRRAFFSGLARARHYLGGAGMSGFLKRIREEAVATLSASERQKLGSVIEEESPIEEVPHSSPRKLVRQWTVEELLDGEASEQDGNPNRGADVFASAACIKCHRFGAQGTLVGPDLTSASRRFNRRDLLVSIIEPSKVIAENYRSLQVVTVDGQTYVGQATLGGDYRSPTLRLATDPNQPFKTIEIPKTEIETQRPSPVSWMPAGLLDTFSRAEIYDLLAYLESSR